MLAVDLDEPPGRDREAPGGDRLVVQARRAPPGHAHLAHGDEGLRYPVEQRLDTRALGTVADQRGVGARTRREAQGVDQQALAGTGLAGKHVERGGQGQPEAIDQREVADRQLEEPARAQGCGVVGHRQEGSSWTFVRRRSQNGIEPSGSTNRIGRSRARTSTTSPTAMWWSSRPSTETRAS